MYIINLTFLTQKVRPFNGGMGVTGGQRKEGTREREGEGKRSAFFCCCCRWKMGNIKDVESASQSVSCSQTHLVLLLWLFFLLIFFSFLLLGLVKLLALVDLLDFFELVLEQVGVLRVGESNSESFCLGLTVRDIGSDVPDPGAVRTNVGCERHVRGNIVVGAHLVGLVATHQKANLLCFLVLQKLDIAGAAFLPFLQLLVVTEKLGTPGKGS